VEVKSGYGLTTRDELKMLRAIVRAARRFPGTVVPTALLGHALDPEQPNFVDRVVEETLPAVHAEFPGVAIDAFCEQNAFSVADCRRLFERALTLGHPVRLHTDQFTAQGGLELGVELGARSVDHLEASSPSGLRALGQSSTYAVLLPVSGFHTDGRYADARGLLAAGGKLVLASNYNPGSSPCFSLPFVIALALRKLQLGAADAIRACTSRAADLLGLCDRGRLLPGARADLILLRHRDERLLGYELGGNPVQHVVVAGREVFQRAA
jgi:imidazolonepropionase